MAAAGGEELLASWNDGAAVAAIREFVAKVTTDGSPEFLAPEERVTVFDNDGTVWCEKPMPIELVFILQRLAAMAERDPALRRLLHDDAEREFAYTAGAERSLEQARTQDWTVVSIRNDWATVFANETAPAGGR